MKFVQVSSATIMSLCMGHALAAATVLAPTANAETPHHEALPDPTTPPSGPDFHPRDRGWEYVWGDDFDGDSLDRTKWTPEVSCWGGGNDEHQCYTDRPQNIQVVNGVLRLIALKEEFTGPTMPPELRQDNDETTKPYTSGKVRSKGLASWRYGRISMRGKLPAKQGAWPAFWMMPEHNAYGSWPLSGEIDIMEAVNLGAGCPGCVTGTEYRSSAALHFGNPWPDNEYVMHHAILPDNKNPADGYHVWAVEWGEGLMHFFLDGEKFWTVQADDWFTAAETDRAIAPFDQPFYVMANFAVGGKYPEENNDLGIADDFAPNEFLIDWIRVYQCAEDPDRGRACMDAP